MTIQGDIRDIRVFGHYGPQNPSVILSDLLSGLGYNIVMMGVGREGAPKELLLTDRSATASTPPLPNVAGKEEKQLAAGATAHPPSEEVDDPQLRSYRHDQKLQHMHDALEKQQQNAPQ
ncbi:MAG: hypothetical protein ABI158_10255 [Edaphobacter sp.]